MSLALAVPVDPELTFKALSYGLVGLFWLTTVALLWISLRKERHYGKPLKGLLGLTVAAVGICVFIALAAYLQKARLPKKVSHRVETVTVNSDALPQ